MLKLLAFSLMTAYMAGGASIIGLFLGYSEADLHVIGILSLVVACIFFFGSHSIIKINNFLFPFLIVTLFALIIFLCYQTPMKFISQKIGNISLTEWGTVITVVFTSFGYHTVTHAIAKICHNDRDSIQKACLLGTAIPTFIYILWTVAVILVVANTDANFFSMILKGEATNVGELVNVLSLATSNGNIQNVIWIVSALSIFTSILGVGFALWHSVREEWRLSKYISVIIVAILPAVIAIVIPNPLSQFYLVLG